VYVAEQPGAAGSPYYESIITRVDFAALDAPVVLASDVHENVRSLIAFDGYLFASIHDPTLGEVVRLSSEEPTGVGEGGASMIDHCSQTTPPTCFAADQIYAGRLHRGGEDIYYTRGAPGNRALKRKPAGANLPQELGPSGELLAVDGERVYFTSPAVGGSWPANSLIACDFTNAMPVLGEAGVWLIASGRVDVAHPFNSAVTGPLGTYLADGQAGRIVRVSLSDSVSLETVIDGEGEAKNLRGRSDRVAWMSLDGPQFRIRTVALPIVRPAVSVADVSSTALLDVGPGTIVWADDSKVWAVAR
jgi:hypothetical protein